MVVVVILLGSGGSISICNTASGYSKRKIDAVLVAHELGHHADCG